MEMVLIVSVQRGLRGALSLVGSLGPGARGVDRLLGVVAPRMRAVHCLMRLADFTSSCIEVLSGLGAGRRVRCFPPVAHVRSEAKYHMDYGPSTEARGNDGVEARE